MPYLDMDTVLMSQPLHEFCDGIRKSEESKNRFWEQIDRTFLLGIPASKMRFVPDNCEGFAECVVCWEHKEEYIRRYRLTLSVDALSSLDDTPDEAKSLNQLKRIGITEAAMSQDIDLSGERPATVPGTLAFKYLPQPKNTIIRQALGFMEEELNKSLAKRERETGRTNGIEFAPIIGFIVTQFFLKYGPDNFEVEERAVEKKPIHAKQAKKALKVPVVRTYKTYTLARNFDFTDRNPIVRKCKLWLVRGHDRHYKDGTVVHIDAYYKGVDRETVDKDNPPPTGRFVKVKPLKLEP